MWTRKDVHSNDIIKVNYVSIKFIILDRDEIVETTIRNRNNKSINQPNQTHRSNDTHPPIPTFTSRSSPSVTFTISLSATFPKAAAAGGERAPGGRTLSSAGTSGQ